MTMTLKQVTAICDFGHSSRSSNLDAKFNMMRSTVVVHDTTSDDICNNRKRGFQRVYQSRKKSSLKTQEAHNEETDDEDEM